MSRAAILASALILVSAPAAAPAAPDWSRAAPVEVRLSNFAFGPKIVRLRAGQPVRLRLVNTSSSGHDFTARRFFAAASVRPQDRAAVGNGSVEVRGRGSREIVLVPKAGRYPLKCAHLFHKAFGMSGEIVVE